MNRTSNHYEASITVTRVTKTVAATKVYNETTRNSDEVETEVDRRNIEVAALKFSASSPKALSTKIAAHIALITDGEADARS